MISKKRLIAAGISAVLIVSFFVVARWAVTTVNAQSNYEDLKDIYRGTEPYQEELC